MAPITFNNAGRAQNTVNPDADKKTPETQAPSATYEPGKYEAGTTDDDRAKLQAELDKIHTTIQEQSQYLSQTDLADLEKLETLVQGYLVVLDQIDAGYLPNSGTGDKGVPGSTVDSANFKTGWNGPADYQKDDTGKYDNIILPYNLDGVKDANGNPTTNGILLKLDGDFEGGKQAVAVTGKNVGNDIEVTIEFDDGSYETDLLKGMVSMPTPLIIAGDHAKQGFIANFSQMKRVGNNDPKKPDLIILGSNFNDTLIGSQGNNQIIANGGDDFMQGGLGGSTSTLDGGDGTDTIKSYSDFDTVTGGAGHDTVTKTSGNKGVTQSEDISDIQTTAADDQYFKGSGWSASAKSDGSELVISQTNPPEANGGTINLTVPNGSMAYGKQDGTDLVVTIQEINDDGTINPDGTKVVRLKGVLSTSSQATINITSDSDTEHPGVIDFGGVNTQFNKVTIKKGLGSDVIIAPKTGLDGEGISAKDIGHATIDPGTATKIKDEMVDAMTKAPDYKPWTTKPTVSGGDITFTPNKDQADFDISPLPEGYQSGVINDKGSEYEITMFIKAKDSSQTYSLVVHVKKTGNNPQNVTLSNSKLPSAAEAVKLLGSDGDDVGGIFVGSKESTDTSKANTDKNKFIG